MFKTRGYNQFTQTRNDRIIHGSGLASDIARITSAKVSMPPRFEGENHAPQITPDDKVKLGEYIGPGTQIIKRAELGIAPVSIVDKVAEIHDIDYQLASDSTTKEEQLKKIRQADLDMLKRLKKIKDRKLDKPANILIGEKAISAKVNIEKHGKNIGTAVGLAVGGPVGAVVGRMIGKKGKQKLEDIPGPFEKLDPNTKRLLITTKQKAESDLDYQGVGSGFLKKYKN